MFLQFDASNANEMYLLKYLAISFNYVLYTNNP